MEVGCTGGERESTLDAVDVGRKRARTELLVVGMIEEVCAHAAFRGWKD